MFLFWVEVLLQKFDYHEWSHIHGPNGHKCRHISATEIPPFMLLRIKSLKTHTKTKIVMEKPVITL